jgi:NADH-quinone oxidoreductase subunit A
VTPGAAARVTFRECRSERMEGYLRPYLPIALYTVVVAATGLFLLFASHLLGPRARARDKESTYECGAPIVGSSRERFSVQFYLVAILFVLFDIETIFLVPWAVIYRSLGVFGLVEMLVFMVLLALGFVYAWRRGGLDWE